MTITLNIGNKVFNWTQDAVNKKLYALTQLKDKNAAWIQDDLTLSPSNSLTRLFWTLIAKFFSFLRTTLYHVDLEQSRQLLEQLQTKIDSANDELLELFNHAVIVFNKCAPRYPIQFISPAHEQTDFGFIEKIDLPKGSQIFVCGDLDGDLKTLHSNLQILQEKGLLDQNYLCKKGFYLVFLGNYLDKQRHGLEVVELLARLKRLNPSQLYLIRGCNDYNAPNKLVDKFYASLPLSVYMGEKKGEYVQFTHGLFELSTDPLPLLSSSNSRERMAISKKGKLSNRISAIPRPCDQQTQSEFNLSLAALRIRNLINDKKAVRDENFTTYTWGNIGSTTELGSPSLGKWHLNVKDIADYLFLCEKVGMIFRSHSPRLAHSALNSEIVVSSLPAKGISYILKTARDVRSWSKVAIIRRSERPIEITLATSIDNTRI